MSRQNSVRAICIFHGRVQGVFFRANTLEYARRIRVTGWVRNLSDGTVEALFEGVREAVERTIQMCREKQPYAQVEDAAITWLDATGEFTEFTIRH